jgi:hypothetical protein
MRFSTGRARSTAVLHAVIRFASHSPRELIVFPAAGMAASQLQEPLPY